MRAFSPFDLIFKNFKEYMLIINIRDGEPIDKALKRYKRKHRQIQLTKELRKRKHFTKPSVNRRNEILNARYRSENYSEV